MDASGPVTPTIYDVAERAGVSIATVSRVLNGRSGRRSVSAARVLAAVEDLGFVPNGAARSLSQGLKRVIGIVYAGGPATDELLDIEEESLLYTDSVVRGAEAGAQRRDFSLMLTGSGPGASEGVLDRLTGKVDGLILLDQVLDERRVEPLTEKVPVVLLAGSGRLKGAVTVRVDNSAGMKAVATHLVEVHGHRRLAFVSGLAASPDSVIRARALVRWATKLGAEVDPLEPWAGDWTSGGAVRVVRSHIESGRSLPPAIVCANDQTAIGVLHALVHAGISVPGDVAVVGFDDIPVARHLSPTLTTVRQPARQLGAVAVEALIDMVEGRPPERHDIVLGVDLQVRGSCGCPSTPAAAWRMEV